MSSFSTGNPSVLVLQDEYLKNKRKPKNTEHHTIFSVYYTHSPQGVQNLPYSLSLPLSGWVRVGIGRRAFLARHHPPGRGGHHPPGFQQQTPGPHGAGGEGPQAYLR